MAENIYREEYFNRIHKVQDYIEQNLGRSIQIEELADVAGFSKYHFSRIFAAILNEPLAHYVNRIKMENALFLLAHRLDMNMTDISYDMGFSDSAVFSRAFKNYYGISPKEYRQEYSKNCKEPFKLSEYNGVTAKEYIAQDICKDKLDARITMEELPETTVVYVRHTGTYGNLAKEYAGLINRLFEEAGKQSLLDNNNTVLAIYHDNPEFGTDTQFRTSLCITITDNAKVIENSLLGSMKLEGGKYAIGHFYIRPDQFAAAWDYMYTEWLTCSGYVPRNACPYEVYRNNPQEDINHMSLVDICVPVVPL